MSDPPPPPPHPPHPPAEYRRTRSVPGVDGKTRSETVSEYYSRANMTFPKRQVGADTPFATAVYAGFEFRTKFGELGRVWVRDAAFASHWAPPLTTPSPTH